MIPAHDLLDQLQREGAGQFSQTSLARNHSPLVRRVRRDRAVRASAMSVAGIAVVGAAAVGVSQYGPSFVTPAVTPSDQTGVPTASPTSPAAFVTVSVGREEPIEQVARSLATVMGVTEDDAYSAITGALPAEAGGYAEGWVLTGEYTVDPGDGLEAAAKALVGTATGQLESHDVPRSKWFDTIVLASVIQQEAPAGTSDQSAVARVLLNRIDQGIALEIESPLAYYLRAKELVSDDGWAVDTPYNTYMYKGLPPSAIGAFTPEALDAAVNPADGDWLYFLRKDDGNVLLFTDVDEFMQAAQDQNQG